MVALQVERPTPVPMDPARPPHGLSIGRQHPLSEVEGRAHVGQGGGTLGGHGLGHFGPASPVGQLGAELLGLGGLNGRRLRRWCCPLRFVRG